MKLLQVGAACVALAVASYAWAAPPEASVGQPLPKASGAKPPPGDAAGPLTFGEAVTGSGVSPGSLGRALDRLQPEGRSVTRGAKETRVYQTASPAVVLIISGDAFGSGVLIDGEGRIVTNHHVVGDATEVGVIFKPRVEGASIEDAAVHRAKVLRRDGVVDLALIQVAEVPSHVSPLKIAQGAAVEVGADVHAIGHPTGQSWTYTRGIVSQIRRDYAWSTPRRLQHKATVIQTQTPINPGNSGGPLLDDDLRVVGINSFGADGEGLNFAVSAEEVNAFLARTGDRAAERAPVPADCEHETLEERPSDDPKGVEYLVDGDCDGEGDYLVIEPDDRRQPVKLLMDEDGDGNIDTVILDEDRDGDPDLALYDTDGDGKIDLRGLYRNGEPEPYRYVKVRE